MKEQHAQIIGLVLGIVGTIALLTFLVNPILFDKKSNEMEKYLIVTVIAAIAGIILIYLRYDNSKQKEKSVKQ